MDLLTLPRGGTFLLRPLDRSGLSCLRISDGYVRLSASFAGPLLDITLAFSGPGQPTLLRLDPRRVLLLEAITAVAFTFGAAEMDAAGPQLIPSWLLAFSLLRHHLGSEQRINQLLCVLARQFGAMQADGIQIPFVLSHTRLAELVGSTRSTVTRHLVRLRDQGDLRISEADRCMLLSPDFGVDNCS